MKIKISFITVITILSLSACSSQIAGTQNTVSEPVEGTETPINDDLQAAADDDKDAVDDTSDTSETNEILISPGDYSIQGVDDDYFDEFETDETVDEQTLQLLELPDSEYDKAITYEEFFSGNTLDHNLILLAGYEEDNIRVFGTMTDNSNQLIIEHNGKRKAFPVGWGAGYKDPVICLFDYDGDGSKEIVFSAMKWHGTGLYRDWVCVFEIGEDITLTKMDERDIADQLSRLISIDFDRQAVVQKDGSYIVDEFPFNTFIKIYNENRTDKELPNAGYSIKKLDIVSFWEIDVNDGNVMLNVRPGLFLNSDDYSDYVCLYDYDTEDSQVFSFKVSYDGTGFILSADKTTDDSKDAGANVSKKDIMELYEKKCSELGKFYYIWDSPKYEIPLLLVTDNAVEGEDAEIFRLGSAYDCTVYYADPQNTELSKMGEIMSDSTVYPIAGADDGLFCAGNHSVYQYIPDFKSGKLVLWYGFEDSIINNVSEHREELEITEGEMKDVEKADAEKAYDAYHSATALSFSPTDGSDRTSEEKPE